MELRARMKPSELRNAFALAKTRAAHQAAAPRLLDFENVEDHTSRVTSSVPLHRPLFEPTPAEVWIDEYTPFHSHTTKLTFRNCDSVARRLKIESPTSPLFKIVPLVNVSTHGKDRSDGKIAAGMELAFLLEFSPQEVKDMAFDLVCCTERERFALPVRVRGRVAALDIPDEIHFGSCPIKMVTSKVLTVHNVGTRGAKFAFRTSENFSVLPEHATLAQGAAVQLEVRVVPPRIDTNQGELSIQDDMGQTAVVALLADVKNLEVYLSAPIVEPAATYISLSSRKTVKICNDSDFPLDFVWKAFPYRSLEQQERKRLLEELEAMESAELELLSAELKGEYGSWQDSPSPFDARKTIEAKYKHLRKAVGEDTMQFVDDSFTVTPVSGRVWANSEVDVTICFSPAIALLYTCYAYLEIGGQEARLPLQIRGQGIGPKAKVIYNELLDFGDVYISDERTRDFTIQNKGEIAAVFEQIPLSPPLPDGMALSVSPSAGSLAVNEMAKIELSFSSLLLGEVFQPIRFRLQGSEDQLGIRFKANVVPPMFRFDVDQIDFGAVSYSFRQTKTFRLINTSNIAMGYSLRIPDEVHYKKKEFDVSPACGRLDAYGEEQICIGFLPMNIKTYDYQVAVQVAGIASDLLRLPIRAQSMIPEVTLQRAELDFGAAYLRYQHKQTLVLENKSTHLQARFDIGEQDDHSRAIACYSANEHSGTLQPQEKLSVEIYLSCEKLGPIRLPMSVTIHGSTDLPLTATLTATGSGPRVELDQLDLDWGSCSCLVDHERMLTMTNASLIPASFKTFIRNARSKFQIDLKEGTVAPGGVVEFKLTANLDDTIVFKDTLHILIAEGDNLVVPLSIKGTGTTMWSPSELRMIDFGHQMTTRECEWSCTLENKGKRSQILTWNNRTATRAKLQLTETIAAATKRTKIGRSSGNGKSGGGDANKADEIVSVFSVFPATIELKPRTACVFLFKGISLQPGEISEELVCETRVGKEKNCKVAFVTEIRGHFQCPTLEPSLSSLHFTYTHQPHTQAALIPQQTQPLSLTNTCALPLSFTLRTQPPFSLDCWEAELQPGEKVDFAVEFYPGFKDDHQSRVVQGKVLITYVGHPQKDSVELVGDIGFPNLHFDTTMVDFGCSLNDTQKTILVTVTNVSKVDTTFRWVFIEDEQEARALATPKKPYIPVNQVFDILPIRGCLRPGEAEKVEFLFYGHANRKFKSLVACEVEGGPEYELTLSGEASSLVYRLDKQSLDFGQVLYNKMEDREFAILNVGKVPFSFNIAVNHITRGRAVVVAPLSGRIMPNDKQRVLVQLKPGIPEPFEETILIEVAHFQPIKFYLMGSGIFAAVSINLPREKHPASTIDGQHPNWRDLRKQAKSNLESAALSASAIAAGSFATGDGVLGGGADSKTSISTGGSVVRTLERGNSSVSGTGPKSEFTGSPSKGAATSNTALRSSVIHSSGIDDLDVEIEASRLFFSEYLVVQDHRRQLQHSRVERDDRIETRDERNNNDDNDLKEKTSSLPDSAGGDAKSKPMAKAAIGGKATAKPTSKPLESIPFVLSQFVLDFGNVVLGTHKVKKFSVVNIGHTPASFQLDKNLVQSRGFQIEPERVVRLPEKQPVEFTVTFQAHKTIALGLHQVQLPISMKNGPPCFVTIRAAVTVPDISISSESIEFGKIAVGTCHTVYTQLQNISAAPAEWSIKKPMGSARDLHNFRITPQNGTLAPGNKVNLQIEFVPDEGRLYALKLPIKVAANAKTRSITLRGEGSELSVSFSPPMVELRPILPCSVPAEFVVELRNDSDYAVDVFSLDFDSVYKEDEEMLREVVGFGTAETLQLPLRTPGQSFVAYLRQSGLLPPASPECVELKELEGAFESGEEMELIMASESLDTNQCANPLVASSEPLARGVDYIVMGPPRSGKSTQAKLLAERENLCVWCLDDAIQAVAMDFESALGYATRAALGLESVGESEPDQSESGKVLDQDIGDSCSMEFPSTTKHPVGSMENLLEQIIHWHLSQPDLSRGGVLDGWENSFLPLEATLRACAKVMPATRIIWLTLDEDAYDAMTVTVAKAEATGGRSAGHLLASPSKDRHSSPKSSVGMIQSVNELAIDQTSLEEMNFEKGNGASNGGMADPDVVSTDGPSADQSDAVNEALAAVQVQLRTLIDAAAAKPRSFADYLHEIPSLRRLVAQFIARDRKTLAGMADAVIFQQTDMVDATAPQQGDGRDGNQTESGEVARDRSETCSPSAVIKSVARSDNFVLDVSVTEAAPPLSIHCSLTFNLEKCIRELELSHLELPAAAKYQLVRRPAQRFSRKPVSHFTIHPCVSSDPARVLDPGIEALLGLEANGNDTADGVAAKSRVETRWTIGAGASTSFVVRFASSEVGVFDSSLGFEIVGIRREFNLFCRGTTSVPQINTDPRNVFMSRVKSRAENAFVHKKFVLSKNQFEFGPLIVPTKATLPPETEDAFAQLLRSGSHESNIESFRISNVSKYALRVDFTLAQDRGSGVFSFAPNFVTLAENETKEVQVWACPSREGLHVDALVCCVSDNPDPVAFSLSCFGCTPSLALRGPWEQPAGDSTNSELLPAMALQPPSASQASAPVSPAPTPRSTGASSARPASPLPLGSPVLDFEQLLLKRQDEKTFFLENTCAVAVSWRFSGTASSLPFDFRLLPLEGTIPPFQKTPVLVTFTANVEALHAFLLQIEFSDAGSAFAFKERIRSVALTLRAEAYKIDVCSFDSDDNTTAGGARDGNLDFGLVRVGESQIRSFTVKNRGKYNVKFILTLRSPASRELFKLDPSELVLEPDKRASVRVTFQSKNREVTLRDSKDIKCTVIEMLSGDPCTEFNVLASARAVFSAFRLQPTRGVNFGPLKFNENPKTKRIEIRNDGEFVFRFRVTSLGSQGPRGALPSPPLQLEMPLSPVVLTVGQFHVNPDCGSVDPGTVVSLEVAFQPKDCAAYRELVCIEISGRNPHAVDVANDAALRYELVGESCYPAISTSDYESIFEEQIVVRSLGGGRGGGGGELSAVSALMAIQTVLFAEKENVFSFGAMVAAANAKGSVERFKISNPTRVPTTVRFQITPAPVGGASIDAAVQAAAAAFSVQPSLWEIPPLEHRFVNVHFKPTAILSYSAKFRAQVEDSPSEASADSTLQFEIRGEGTMPCITVVEPVHRDGVSGALVMDFGRVQVPKMKEQALVVRNDGILSATVLFSMPANPNFFFAHGNGSIVVAPRTVETMVIQFKPQKPHDESVVSVLKITVQNNAFEETSVRMLGLGYREDLIFEDLPHGHDDELHFDDIVLSLAADEIADSDVKTFTLLNQSNEVVRFAWPSAPPFSFSPSIGHLQPRGYKLIKATFKPADRSKAVVFENHKLQLQTQRIALKPDGTGVADWDDTMHGVSFDESSLAEQQVTADLVAEPAFAVHGSPLAITLSCFAAADTLSFTSEARSIAFKRTFMLQVCSHRITIKNTSKIQLGYVWRWVQAASTDFGSRDFEGDEDEDDECPFDITPSHGNIAADASQTFVVRFAPMEVDNFQYELRFMPTCAEAQYYCEYASEKDHKEAESPTYSTQRPLCIAVTGSSSRPVCHFDVERSEYPARRALHLPGPTGELGLLDPSIRVIEMESLGVRVKNTKRFYVVNPTNVSYEFTWTLEGDASASFRCATPKGLMLAGKRCEMIFEFTPQQLELQEAYWRFSVPHFQVNQLFLFVGTTTEPRVSLDRGSVNFNTLLIGTKTSQSVWLMNHEHIPFNFVFDKTSIDFAGETPALLVHPLSGVIPPNGRVAIDLEFIPTEEKGYSFNLICIVKRKPTRLSLNVKGEGYSIHDALTVTGEDPLSDARQAVAGSRNFVDFGAVRVHESSIRYVAIHNTGKFNFEFNWFHASKSGAAAHNPLSIPALTVEPLHGTVRKNDKTICTLTFAPVKPVSLDTLGQLTCTIAGARHYAFSLHGAAVPPSLHFSFTSYDFGPCFIADVDALPLPELATLSIFNMDAASSVDLDCLYEKKPYLRVDCPPTVLGPRESVSISIVFTARQEVSYSELIPFVINGSSTVTVNIRGEGIAPKIELANSAMQLLTFGSLHVGQLLTRSVKIINRAKQKAGVELLDEDGSLQSLGIAMFPQHQLVLKSKESADIEFQFAPTQRVVLFRRDVYVRVAGSRKKLLTLTGACASMDVQLEMDSISFGTVCLGSQLVRKVHLQNRGDMAAKFQWNARAFAPDFAISPAEGVVAPNSQKALEVTFKPTSVRAESRCDRLACGVESADPLYLTLAGSCVHQATSSIQDVHFEAAVRQETFKAVTIENKTTSPWDLLPVVQGDHWLCPENVAVPAEGKASLKIMYRPLTMTKQRDDCVTFPRPEQHEGSVFLAIPDGTALLYKVFGKAYAPTLAGSLNASTQAKKSLPISIPIANWLKQPQVFSVDIQNAQGESPSVIAQGAPTLALQPSATRNYHLKFFSYTEGSVALTVRFVNRDNGEYLEYEVRVTVTHASEVETICLDAPVRQSIKKSITIENPFGGERVVEFTDKDKWWKCSSPFVRVRQLSDINARLEGVYEVEYRPTLHKETPTEETLTISFVELGDFTYKLVLTTQTAGVERLLHFKAPLGGSQSQIFTFTTFSDIGADLACSVQQPGYFSVPTGVRVESTANWEGKTHTVLVKFEPEALGDIRDTLVLQSDVVGEYRCSLQGAAVPPLPQGPFVFSGSKDIEFKNVFSSAREFEFVVDNPKFVVSAKSLSIPAKTSKTVTVRFDASAGGGKPTGTVASVTGKLLVSCPSIKGVPPWVYYLEATLA